MPINIDHADKRVLVIGAGQALRQALVRAFRALGAGVVEGGAGPGQSRNAVVDSRKLVGETLTKLGGLDILVTCTGVEASSTLESATLDTWESGFSGPLKAAFFATQAALPALKASRGAIVNVTSVLGQMGAPAGLAIPAASMACIVHHTRMLALRSSVDGIRVNCVCHGFLSDFERTGVMQRGPEAASPANDIPLGRLATPEDITGSVLFLASPLASYITGAILTADGGIYAGS